MRKINVRKIIARSLPYSLIEPPKSFKINVLTNIIPCTIINGMINFKIKCIIDVIKRRLYDDIEAIERVN